MSDWKDTRLVVTYKKGSDPETEISPIDSFTPTFSLNAEVIHSIERTHAGVVYSPQAMSFSMTVKAIGDVAAKLTVLALSGTPFNVVLKEKVGDDWAFANVVMSDCVITSATPTSATPMGAPTATFSGFSLGAGAETNDHTKVAIGAGT
jgi:hypothetical protein